MDSINFLKIFGFSTNSDKKTKTQNTSAQVAKERLKILVAHNCLSQKDGFNFIPAMQNEILEVVKKYVDIDSDNVSVNLESQSDGSILEVNVQLPS